MRHLLLLGLLLLLGGCNHHPASTQSVSCRMVRPDMDGDGRVVATPDTEVELEWIVQNDSAETLFGLDAETDCKCRTKVSPPTELAPGQSSQLVLHFPSPPAGTIDRKIRLLGRSKDQDGSPIVAGVINFAITVPFDPPRWLIKPERVQTRVVEGKQILEQIEMQSLERTKSAPWITGAVNKEDQIKSQDFEMIEVPMHEDPTVSRRTYRMTVAANPLSTGQHTRTLILDSASESGPFILDWKIDVRPGLTASTNTVTLGSNNDFEIINTSRTGNSVTAHSSNDSLVTVMPLQRDEASLDSHFTIKVGTILKALPVLVKFREEITLSEATVLIHVEP